MFLYVFIDFRTILFISKFQTIIGRRWTPRDDIVEAGFCNFIKPPAPAAVVLCANYPSSAKK